MEAALATRLVTAIEGLNEEQISLLTLYAEALKSWAPTRAALGYLEILLKDGLTAESLLRAATAVASVERRLMKETDAKAGWESLRQRTEERVRAWCQTRGIDYNFLSEDQFSELLTEQILVRGHG